MGTAPSCPSALAVSHPPASPRVPGFPGAGGPGPIPGGPASPCSPASQSPGVPRSPAPTAPTSVVGHPPAPQGGSWEQGLSQGVHGAWRVCVSALSRTSKHRPIDPQWAGLVQAQTGLITWLSYTLQMTPLGTLCTALLWGVFAILVTPFAHEDPTLRLKAPVSNRREWLGHPGTRRLLRWRRLGSDLF